MTSTVEFIANVQTEVDNLKIKITALENQKVAIDSEISKIRTEIKKRNDLLMVWEGKGSVMTKEEMKIERRGRSGGGMKVILEVLESARRPLNAREVLDGLVSRNATGTAKKPILSVRSALQILKKKNQVVSAGHGLFALAGK